jgi:hypothetical protein
MGHPKTLHWLTGYETLDDISQILRELIFADLEGVFG